MSELFMLFLLSLLKDSFILFGLMDILLFLTVSIRFSNLFIEDFFLALVAKTGTPKHLERLLQFIYIPFLDASSIKLTHTMTFFVSEKI